MLENKDVWEGKSGNMIKHQFKQKRRKFHLLGSATDRHGFTKVVDKCSVDVIIPYYGRFDLVRRCLSSVLNMTISNPFLIHLVDSGTPNESAQEFADNIKQAPNVKYHRIENPSFGAAINIAIKGSKEPYVCILHSDTEIRMPGWLERMGEALLDGKKENVRMVVAKTENKLLKESYKVSDSPLSFHCCMFHRDLINKVGYFKEYEYYGYEDEEYFYRMNRLGFKMASCGTAWVQHQGGGTVSYLREKGIKFDNRERCIEDLRALYNK